MRTSTYEIIAHVNGEKDIIFNGLTGALDIIPAEIGSILESDRHREITFLLESVSSTEDIVLLQKRGHITELSRESEYDICIRLCKGYEKMAAYTYSAAKFMILPTYDCNFRCPYCYEQTIDDRKCSKGNPLFMSKEQVENIFGIIGKFPYIKEKSQMEIFGGEPLFAKTLPIVSSIVSHAKEAGRNIGCTTNGYDLHLFEKYLGPDMIANLLVTLDGPEEINNRRRIALDGGNTFARIIENINLALDHGVEVTLRVNLDKTNIDGYEALIKYLIEKSFFKHPLFHLSFARVKVLPGNKCTWLSTSNLFSTDVELLSKLEDLFDDKTILQKGICDGKKTLIESIRTTPMITSKTRYCGAVGSSLYFSPDGYLYVCSETVGHPELAIGTYDTNLHINKDRHNQWREYQLINLPKCLKCPLVFMCSGGCAYRAMYVGNEREPYCDHALDTFAYRLKMEAQVMNLV